MVVAGDSTACTMIPGLTAVAPSYGFQVQNASVVGCGIVSDRIAPDVIDSQDIFDFTKICYDETLTQESQALRRGAPKIVVWDSIWERESLAVDHNGVVSVLRVGTPAWRSELLRRMDGRLRMFSSTGAVTVVLLQPSFARPSHAGPVTPDDLTFQTLNSVLRSFASQHPGQVALVDLAPRICPSGPPCPYRVDGFVPRPDSAHYSGATALWLARWLVPQIVSAAATLQHPQQK